MPKQHEHLTADDLKVMTLRQWAASNALSWGTARRLLAAGDGPVTVQLSPRRRGVRVIDNARWQQARLRSA